MIDKQTLEFYKSAQVIRWHNKPDIPGQTNSDHSFGMILLLIKLHPNPSSELFKAIALHDLGEAISGDFAHDAKRRFPVLKKIAEQCQAELEQKHGVAEDLIPNEKLWLKYLDQLEPLYYMHCHGITGEIFDRTSENASRLWNEINTFTFRCKI